MIPYLGQIPLTTGVFGIDFPALCLILLSYAYHIIQLPLLAQNM